MKETDKLAALEALLFAAGDPLPRTVIAEVLQTDERETDLLLDQLKRRYLRDPMSGLRLCSMRDRVMLSTKPCYREIMERLFEPDNRPRLSRASYETLAVIAYNEPVTRAEIEAVRGVNSDSIVTRLISLGLVEARGVLDVPGQPALLFVTDRFLADFGLGSTAELPAVDLLMYDSVRALEQLKREAEAVRATEEGATG